MIEQSTLIGEGQNSLIYLHKGKEYPDPVILKVLKEDHNFYPHTAALVNEINLTKNLNIKGVRSSLEMQDVEDKQVLVLEYFEGKTIKQFVKDNNVTFIDKLKITHRICEIIHQLHDKDIIHHDISSNNILLNDLNDACLIDFGLASNVDMKLDISGASDQSLAGTLPYISPEQTGRVNHVVDQRSDLYSLGAVFYELFTGRLPFDFSDPMELVHAHLAIKPAPLSDVAPGLPEVLSDIVLKLLSKDIEGRYQSARGLQSDIQQCLDQLDMQVAIEKFSLGKNDQKGRFLIPSKLYGRDTQKETLLSSFERLGTGSKEITLITGHSGTGKTSLVYEIHKPITRQKGIFLSGKHEQLQKDKPYIAIAQAFHGFFNLILSENEETLSYWKKRLRQALGKEGKLLTDLIPNLELIIGKQPPLDTLGLKESQNRFNYVFLKFIAALANERHPMVLFIDDLQWADIASLELLKMIIQKEDLEYFYFIGSYRDNEIDDSHPTKLIFDQIEESGTKTHLINLPGLSEDDACSLIQDTFSLDRDKAAELTKIAYTKTAGNPFFLDQFLRSIYDRGFIVYDKTNGEWQWDISLLESMNFTDNVVEFMIQKIKTLEPLVQKTLQLASCIGDRFDLRTLAFISNYSVSDMKINIWNAVKEQMVTVQKNNSEFAHLNGKKSESQENYITYKFAHDRIRQAAYELIPQEEKASLHEQIGRLLLEKTGTNQLDDFIFEIVYQLNNGNRESLTKAESHELIRLNFQAGKKAKSSNAYQTALSYYQIALSHLDESYESSDPLTYFQLHLECMKCCYLNGSYDEMHKIADKLLAAKRPMLEEIQVKNIIIHAFIAQSKYVELLQLAVDVLKKIGIKLPQKASDTDVLLGFAKTKFLLRNKADHFFETLPRMSDEVYRIAVNMMTSVSTASYHNFPKLFPVVIFKSLNLALKYGNSLDIMAFYGGYGSILCGVTGEYQKGYNYGKLSLRLLDKYDDTKAIRPKAYVIFGCFISHWKDHLQNSVDYLRQAYVISMETGDRQYAVSGLFLEAYTRFWLGEHLNNILPTIEGHYQKILQLNQKSHITWISIFYQAALKIYSPQGDSAELSGEIFDVEEFLKSQENSDHVDRTATFHIRFHQMYLYFMAERYEEALENSELVVKDIEVVLSTIYVPLYYFYDALIRLQLVITGKQSASKSIKKVKSAIGKFKKWAKNAPVNFQHKLDLIQALLEVVRGNTAEAESLFQKSIDGATTNGYTNEVALGNNLFAVYHQVSGNESQSKKYFKKAHHAYKQWGAINKVRQLEELHPHLAVSQESMTVTSEMKSVTAQGIGNKLLDLSTIMKASSAIASEIQLHKVATQLLKIVIENAGAQNGTFLQNSEGKLTAIASGNFDKGVKLIDTANSEYPESVVQYVYRTGKKIVLDDAVDSEQFASDEYIIANQLKSVICLPILHHGELLGIIYLENNLIKGAFTIQRIDLLTLLSGQIAVSLYNALLYNNLEQKVQERTRQIEEKNSTLKDLNAEKDYLISMVSHDLRTPLYGIRGFAGLAAKKVDHDKITDFTNPIIESIDRLDAMITRILDISAINAKEIALNPTEFDLSYLLAEIAEAHKILADNKQIEIVYEEQITQANVLLDREALTQVFNNLLSNAIKFSEKNSKIELNLHLSDDEIIAEVKDEGPGISKREQKLLFSQFRKLTPSATGGEQSSGLGLAIVKKYVGSMNGRVWCESEVGVGTSFFIAFKR
ncbi:MAG: ATP-binding sensor histidine kinase [Bacteroidota bacterium]